MYRRICILILMLSLVLAVPVWANTGMNYLKNQSLVEEKAIDLKELSLIIKSYRMSGNELPELKNKLTLHAENAGIIEQAFALLATGDASIAERMEATQQLNGSWEESTYQTALVSYALLDNNLKVGTAQAGLDYLISTQNSDGGWGEDGKSGVEETAVALLALSKNGYQSVVTKNALKWLIIHQNRGYSWGNKLADTAWVALALMEVGDVDGILAGAITTLQHSINDQGGWGLVSGDKTDPYTSAIVLWVLQKYDSSLPQVVDGLVSLNQFISSESWLNASLAYYKLSEIYHLLWDDPDFTTIKGSYYNWLINFAEQQNHDYIARRVSLLAKNGNNTTLIDQLTAHQNKDGGWGFKPGHVSNVWDTVVVLRAFIDAEYLDLNLYGKIINYLSSVQSSDGSFGLQYGDPGHLYLTTVVVEELTRLEDIVDVTSIIGTAKSWLVSNRDGMGGYNGSTLENARALGVTMNLLTPGEVQNTVLALKNAQHTNGSWENDSLTTAAVLKVLQEVKPDLSIQHTDFTFQPEEINVTDQVTISINVANVGYAVARDAEVKLYQGDVETGTLLLNESISEIGAGQSKAVSVLWDAKVAGTQLFSVTVDGGNQITEKNEENNVAVKAVTVIPKRDLALDADELVILPEDPGPADILKIKANLKNMGSMGTGAFEVAISNGDPRNGGTILGTITHDGLAGYASELMIFETKLPEGEYDIFVTVDAENTVIEDIEDNNIVSQHLTVTKRYDLAINYDDIVFSHGEPVENEQVEIRGTILNLREEPIDQVQVAFYLGDPSNGGILLGTETIDHIDGNKSGLVTYTWDTTGLVGRQLIYVVVDPENVITETDELNNKALNVIYTKERADLTLTEIYPYSMTEGTPGTIILKVLNEGGITSVPSTGSVYLVTTTGEEKLIDTTIPALQPNQRYDFYLGFDTVNRVGTYTVKMKLDVNHKINESDETNNELSKEFTVKPAPELNVTTNSITFEPNLVYNGDPSVAIHAEVENLTAGTAYNVVVRISHRVNGEWMPLHEETRHIYASQKQIFTTYWNASGQVGTNHFKVEVDPDHAFYERDKSNNFAENVLEVNEAIYPDLQVRLGSIKTSEAIVLGDIGTLEAEIVNLRTVAAPNVVVKFYDGNPAEGGTEIGQDLIEVPGLNSTQATISLNTSGMMSLEEIYVQVDPENLIIEHNEENNDLSGAIRLRSDSSYQPQNFQQQVSYTDVYLSWDAVEKVNLAGYLLYKDGTLSSEALSHGTVNVSGTSSHGPEKAIDGDSGTYWRANWSYDPKWFEEEFAEYKFVEEIEIEWNNNSSYIPDAYQIQVWNGEGYVTVIDVSENTLDIVKHTLQMPVKKYRIYMLKEGYTSVLIEEINVTGVNLLSDITYTDRNLQSGNYEYSLSAINTQGEESLPATVVANVLPPVAPAAFNAQIDGSQVHLTWEPSTIADSLGYYLRRDGVLIGETEKVTVSTVTASHTYSDRLPERMIDGDWTNYWQSNSANPWVEFELSEERYISDVTVDWYPSTSHIPESYQILIWQDGKWIEVAEDRVENGQYLKELSVDQAPKTNKVRIQMFKNSGWNTIREIEIFAQQRLTVSYLDAPLKAKKYNYELTVENSLFSESIPVSVQAQVNPPLQVQNLTGQVDGENVNLSWEHQQEAGFVGYLVYKNGTIANASQSYRNVATEAVVTALDSNGSYTPDKAIDGDISTYWRSYLYPVWYQLEFSQKRLFSGLDINWHSSYNATNYRVEYKSGDQWIPIVNNSNNQEIVTNHQFAETVYTDAIRIKIITGRTSSVIIDELALYEIDMLTETSFTDQNLLDGEYTYQVVGVDDAENIGLPTAVTVSVGDVASPINLQATADQNQVTLDWQIASMDNVAGFAVYRDLTRINAPINITKDAIYQASVYNTDAYRVGDNNVNSTWAPYATHLPATLVVDPGEVAEVREINLVWKTTAASDFDVYAMQDGQWISIAQIRNNIDLTNRIRLDQFITASQFKVELINAPGRVYLAEFEIYEANLVKNLNYVDQLINNDEYYYHVQAVANNGEMTTPSNQVYVEVNETIPPVTPSGFTVIENNGYLRLEWTKNQEVDLAGYNIYLAESELPLNSSLLSKTSSAYNHNLVTGIRDYSFKLEAVDINGNISLPAETSFSFTSPAIPLNLATTVDKKDITLTWNLSTSLNVSGYMVYRDGQLINELSNPQIVKRDVTSTYYDNTNYQGTYATDSNERTFWRPRISDSMPMIELEYKYVRFLTAIDVVWHNESPVPTAFVVEAWVDGNWRPILNQDDFAESRVMLDQLVITNKIRLVIQDNSSVPSLAEFASYYPRYNSYKGTNFSSGTLKDTDLQPAIYDYQVSTVNRAGLESEKSVLVSAEITSRDLGVQAGDLYYTPYRPSIFDNITLTTKVTNTGMMDIVNIPVAFYAGHPETGGREIGRITISNLKAGENTLVQYIWRPTENDRILTLYTVVDPDHTIYEYDETNNIVEKAITITQFSSLYTSVVDVDSSEFPRIKLGVQVNNALGNGVAGLSINNFTQMEDGRVEDIVKLTSQIDQTDQLSKIDLVFVIDTSGSMGDEWASLPTIIRDLLDELTKRGLDLSYHVYGLGNSSWLNLVPGAEPLPAALFNGEIVGVHSEHWAPGTSWIAENYQWREDAYRFIVPVSDECPYAGDGYDANDEQSIIEAIDYSQRNNVEVYPLYGGGNQSVIDAMNRLAQETGEGEAFYFEDANQVANYFIRALSARRVDYWVEYDTSNISRDGTLRNVDINSSYRGATEASDTSGTGEGLKAEYYDKHDLTDLKMTQLDTTVDFNWESGSPSVLMDKDYFSVRWSGQVEAKYDEEYTFYTNTGDGVRLWVDDVLLVDQWRNQGTTEYSGTLTLKAGQRYDIKMEYYEATSTAEAHLSWSSASQVKEIIPTAYLYPISETGGEGEYVAPQDLYSDLVASSLTSTPVSYSGDEMFVTGVMQNNGGVIAEGIRVALYLDEPTTGILLDTKEVSSLAPNNSTDLAYTWTSQAGTHDLYLVIDPENQIPESDETNNVISITEVIPGTEKADLFISEFTLNPFAPHTGERVDLKATVRNSGLGSGPFAVSFYEGDPAMGGQLIATKQIDSLDYLGSQEIETVWITDHQPGQVDIYVVVDPLNDVVEHNEANNQAQMTVEVSSRLITGQITTDQSTYQPEEDVVIDTRIENHQILAWTGTAKVLIQAMNGSTIEELSSFEIDSLIGLIENVPGQWENQLVWNVGTLTPGTYLASLQLFENGDQVVEVVTEFTILADQALTGDFVTDKLSYQPQETAVITVDYRNISLNAALDNLSLQVTATNLIGEEVWTDQLGIPYLAISQTGSESFYWELTNQLAGDYDLTVEIKTGETLLWSEMDRLTIEGKALIDGGLTVDQTEVRIGDLLNFTYQLTNAGNIDIEDFTADILIVNIYTQDVVEILSNNHSLTIEGVLNDTQNTVVNIPDGHYMAILQAKIGSDISSLDVVRFLVDSTAPVTEYQLSNLRFEQNGVLFGLLSSQLAFSAEDNLIGVAEILYDLGTGYQPYVDAIPFAEEAKYVVTYKSSDLLNNVEVEKSIVVVIDETAPTVNILEPITGSEVDPEFAITVEAADNVELDYVELYVDGELYATDLAAGTFTVNLDPGIYTLTARAVDLAGYETWNEGVMVEVINPDSIPPVTSINLTGDLWSSEWYNELVTVTLSAEDNEGGTGVAAIYYQLGANGPVQTYTEPFTIEAEGIHELYAYAVDNIGNVETTQMVEVKVAIPSVAGTIATTKESYLPLETATIVVDYLNDSQYTDLENVTLDLQLTTATGEVILTEQVVIASLVAGANGSQSFDWNIGIALPGDYTVTAEITANNTVLWSDLKTLPVLAKTILTGNLSVRPIEVKADERVVLSYQVQNLGNTTPEALVKILLINAETEEVVKVLSHVENLALNDEAAHYFVEAANNLPNARYNVVLEVEATDEVFTLDEGQLSVDTIAPITQHRLSNPVDLGDGVLGGKFSSELYLVATDNLSGVDTIMYNLGAGYQSYTQPITFPTEGRYVITYKAIDQFGNEETEKSVTVIIDETAPITTVELSGDQWSDGDYKSAVEVTLSAEDNENGTGVAAIYYRFGADGPVQTYTEPFTVDTEGLNELYVYAVDRMGNTETPQLIEFTVIYPWVADYNLLVQELENHGNVGLERVFSNGDVTIAGSSLVNYLGTTRGSIDTKGKKVKVNTLETNQPYRYLPEPDWNALRAMTTVQKGKTLNSKKSFSNIWYENDLKVTGQTTITGILVVEGDLEISGQVDLSDTGIYCTGTVTINSNAVINGVIWAGEGLKVTGTPEINGAVIVDGLADIGGDVENNETDIDQYLYWLKKRNSSSVSDQNNPNTRYELSHSVDLEEGVFGAKLNSELTLIATDDQSGVDSILYNMGDGYKTYTQPITFANEGRYEISYKAIDKEGNEEVAKSIIVVVDETAPIVTIKWSGQRRVSLSAKDNDGGTGVAAIYYKVGFDGEYKLYTEPFNIKPGQFVLASAVDRNGNNGKKW